MVTLVTFGDSILDSGRYNPFGLNPGMLLVKNDDERFPEFRGRDLVSRGPARLDHRARDGALLGNLAAQLRGLEPSENSIAILTVGGNDLLDRLLMDTGAGIAAFARGLDAVVRDLPIRPILIGNVYDPTFGDDSDNFIGLPPAIARANFRRVNATIGEVAARHGALVDLHAHFLTGDPSWFTQRIEPSLTGTSEVRRAFLDPLLALL
jgi:lysophospholipase L1-like esterase